MNNHTHNVFDWKVDLREMRKKTGIVWSDENKIPIQRESSQLDPKKALWKMKSACTVCAKINNTELCLFRFDSSKVAQLVS